MRVIVHQALMALSPPVGVDWTRPDRILSEPESSQTKVCLWTAKEGGLFSEKLSHRIVPLPSLS